MKSTEYVTLEATLVYASARAYCLQFPDRVRKWVPRSVVSGPLVKQEPVAGEIGEVRIAAWFCKKEGLI